MVVSSKSDRDMYIKSASLQNDSQQQSLEFDAICSEDPLRAYGYRSRTLRLHGEPLEKEALLAVCRRESSLRIRTTIDEYTYRSSIVCDQHFELWPTWLPEAPPEPPSDQLGTIGGPSPVSPGGTTSGFLPFYSPHQSRTPPSIPANLTRTPSPFADRARRAFLLGLEPSSRNVQLIVKVYIVGGCSVTVFDLTTGRRISHTNPVDRSWFHFYESVGYEVKEPYLDYSAAMGERWAEYGRQQAQGLGLKVTPVANIIV